MAQSRKRAASKKPVKKSSRRKMSSGPSSTQAVAYYPRPELKNIQYKSIQSLTPVGNDWFKMIGNSVTGDLFRPTQGTQMNNRIGNRITTKGIQVKYKYDGEKGPLEDTARGGEINLWLVRDNEAHAAAPTTALEWTTALFDESQTSLSSRWTNNFRNPDYTTRFQVLKAMNLDCDTFKAGNGGSIQGYFDVPLNQEVKFPARQSDEPSTNVRYYLLFHAHTIAGTGAFAPEIDVKCTYTDS